MAVFEVIIRSIDRCLERVGRAREADTRLSKGTASSAIVVLLMKYHLMYIRVTLAIGTTMYTLLTSAMEGQKCHRQVEWLERTELGFNKDIAAEKDPFGTVCEDVCFRYSPKPEYDCITAPPSRYRCSLAALIVRIVHQVMQKYAIDHVRA
jgi:hypothetical protein